MTATTEVPQAARKSLPVLVDEALSEVGALLKSTTNRRATEALSKASMALSCCKAHLAEQAAVLLRIDEAMDAAKPAWEALREVTDAPAGETGGKLVERAVEVIRGLTEWIASDEREAA